MSTNTVIDCMLHTLDIPWWFFSHLKVICCNSISACRLLGHNLLACIMIWPWRSCISRGWPWSSIRSSICIISCKICKGLKRFFFVAPVQCSQGLPLWSFDNMWQWILVLVVLWGKNSWPPCHKGFLAMSAMSSFVPRRVRRRCFCVPSFSGASTYPSLVLVCASIAPIRHWQPCTVIHQLQFEVRVIICLKLLHQQTTMPGFCPWSFSIIFSIDNHSTTLRASMARKSWVLGHATFTKQHNDVPSSRMSPGGL